MNLKSLFSRRAAAASSSERRSSSASHFSQDYQTTVVDNDPLVWKFHGIPVSNDIRGASTTDLICLALLILLLVFKNRIIRKSTTQNTASIWTAALAISVPLYKVIWLPLLATTLMTRVSYQHLICISHCIVACCCYRSEVEARGHDGKRQQENPPLLSSFGLTFVCWGFGGSLLSDCLMGLPITAVGHSRIVPSYILGYFLAWYSPLDIVYTSFQDKTSLWYTVLNLAEAVDTVTTPMGRISRSANELKNKTSAPLTAGMLVGVGGAVIRYFERVIVQGNSAQSGPSLAAFQAGVWRTLGYCLIWWYLAVYPCLPSGSNHIHLEKADHCRSFDGSDDVRFVIVLTYCIWTILCQMGVMSRHPFVWYAETVIVPTWTWLVDTLQLGKAPRSEDEDEETEYTKKQN